MPLLKEVQPPGEAAPVRKRAGNAWFWFCAKLGISLTLLAWLFSRFDLDLATLTPTSAAPLAAGLVATLAQPFSAAFRWQMILQLYGQRLRFREVLRIVFIAAFMNQFLPASVGGDAVRVYMLHRRGAGLSPAIASTLLDRATAMLGLVLIVVVTIPRVLDVIADDCIKYLLIGVAALLCAGVAVIVSLSDFLETLRRRFRFMSPFALFASGLRDLPRNRANLFAMLTASVVVHVLSGVGLWAALHAFDQQVSLLDVLAVFAPIILFQMLPISVGGWGVRELMAVAMLAALAVPANAAIASSIFLGLLYAVASVPGCIAWLIGGKREAPGVDDGAISRR